jgi:hypothetical protein
LKAYADEKMKAQFQTSNDRYSGSFYWATGPDKKLHWMQADRMGGGAKEVNLPDGYNPAPGMNYVDTPTDVIGMPKYGYSQPGDNGAPVIPKDNAGAASQTAIGKGQGETSQDLPQAENAANMMLDSIDNLINDPYLDSMLGPINSRMPNLTGDASRVQSKMDQIQGQTFLQAYNYLRHSGAISDIEGTKGERALARMAAAQNPKDYRDAATELRTVVVNGVKAMQTKAGQAPTFSPPSSNVIRYDAQGNRIQ